MKKLYHDDGKSLWEFYIDGRNNPCGCGSNMFHYEYNGKKMYGVCNLCGKRIYTLETSYIQGYLDIGKWIDTSGKKPEDYTVLVDIDDTIEDLCGAWCRWLNERYGTSVKHEDVVEWDVSKFFPTLTREQVYEPLHDDDFWYTIEPLPGAIKYLEMMINDGYNLYLCTSTDYRNVKPKYEAIIQRYFPFIDWRKIIIAHNKQMINADFLIDDGTHNLEGGNYNRILMTAPHNKGYDAALNNMIRVYTWEEAYNVVRRLSGANNAN